jgi:hypothetical protein
MPGGRDSGQAPITTVTGVQAASDAAPMIFVVPAVYSSGRTQ